MRFLSGMLTTDGCAFLPPLAHWALAFEKGSKLEGKVCRAGLPGLSTPRDGERTNFWGHPLW